MAAGSSSQNNFRKAIAAIKDSTSVGMAKVNSEYKALTVSILKATNHVEVLPKEKHVRTILGAVSSSKPRADVSYCIHTLTKRLAKTHTWVVALKTLIVIHRAMREVDLSFCEELIYYNRNRGHMLSLFHINDDSSLSAWEYSMWIRAYALYLEECLECYHVIKYDFHRDHSRMKKFDTPALLDQLPALQELLFRLLNCKPTGAAQHNCIIQYAISIVALESVRIYVAITDGVLILVDKFFEMQHRDAVRALDIYRREMEQAQGLSEFFEVCRRLNFGTGQKFITIEQPPASFLAAMEEYVINAPHTLTPPPAIEGKCDTPKLLDVPEANSETNSEQEKGSQPTADSREGTNLEKRNADAAAPIPDLMSWDEPTQDTSQVDENNSLTTPGLDDSSLSDNWELTLVADTNSNAASANSENKHSLPNVLDRSVLDSLYNAPQTIPNANGTYPMQSVSTNPFEDNNHSQMCYYQSLMIHPGQVQADTILPDQQHNQMTTYSYMQIAGIAPPMQGASTPHQQQHYQQNQSMAPYNRMQVAGITQLQQQPFSEQQESSSLSFNGQDLMEVSELSELESSMQQQQEGKQKACHDTSNQFGNPFEDQKFPFEKQSSTAVAPHQGQVSNSESSLKFFVR